MVRFFKVLFLITIMFSLSNCEEREEIDARKIDRNGGNGGGGGNSDTARNFIASFTSGGSSLEICPDGPGAQILIDFSTSLLAFDIPVRDTNGAPSDLLAAANAAKVQEGNPTLDSQSEAFTGSYIVSDSEGDLDITACDNANGGYAGVTRLSISGSIGTDGIVSGNYEIVNLCNTGNSTAVVCEGTLAGSEVSQ